MRNRKIFMICGSIVLVLVILIFLFFFFRGISEDSKVTSARTIEIKKLNQNIENYIHDYNEVREQLNSFLSDIYTDDLKDRYDELVLLLHKENNYVTDVKEIVLKLDNSCDKDSFSNNICLQYQVDYEEMVNVFVSDISFINHMIDTYNDSHDELLDHYVSSDIQDYIDYNKDGIYSGKEE